MKYKKIVISLDSENIKPVCQSYRVQNFPIKEFRDFIIANNENVDVVEMFTTLVERWVDPTNEAEVARKNKYIYQASKSIELQGSIVLSCPIAKPQKGETTGKQSDDQILMIETIRYCLTHDVDFLYLLAGDIDYAPMVRVLREEGVRTEIFADMGGYTSNKTNNLSQGLERIAYKCHDINEFLFNYASSSEAYDSNHKK